MKVRYDGAVDIQVRWGSNDDPQEYGLIKGEIYTVKNQEIHSWHTKIILEEFPTLKFNDSSFTYINE
jgi:hypothetical protein